MKINIPPFYVGQKVMYITGDNMPKNSTHIVSDIWQKECGCWVIQINNNIEFATKKSDEVWRCAKCKSSRPNSPNTVKAGWLASSFRAIEEIKTPLMTFKEIREKEKEEVLIMN